MITRTRPVENLYEPDCIRTYMGTYFNVFDPKPSLIHIEDIAHVLAQECRFGGHLPFFYSVAQHSLAVMNQVPKPLKLQALLHDASEAYLRDIPKPIKDRMPEYKAIENNLMVAIASRFGFDWPKSREVKEADEAQIVYEWENCMISINPIEGMAPADAEVRFLRAFYKLTHSSAPKP